MNNADIPAMPFVDFDYDGHATDAYHGLTKREYFAAMAMQGLIGCDRTIGMSFEQMADKAVKQADALLAELERTR